MASFHDRLMDAYDLVHAANGRITTTDYNARLARLGAVVSDLATYEDEYYFGESTSADRQALRDRIGAGLRFATEGLR